MNTRQRSKTKNSIDTVPNQNTSCYQASTENSKRAHSRIRAERRAQQKLEKARNSAINNLNEILTPSTAQTSLALTPSSYNIASSTSRANSQIFTSILNPEDFFNKEAVNILKDMTKKARQNEFPTKVFNKNGKKFGYTSYLHFTRSISETTSDNQKLDFQCIFCGAKITAVLGETSNVKAHMERHKNIQDLVEWLSRYKEIKSSIDSSKVDEETLNFIKYFIASNSAISELDSIHFRNLFASTKIKMPCSNTFSEKIVPSVFELLNKEISSKLNKALTICLISDIWTNPQMVDFLGLAVNLMYQKFVKEILVIGMVQMDGSHCAENIKAAIERIINNYNFDKSKISEKNHNYQIKHFCLINSTQKFKLFKGSSTDEGSAFVRLFKPKYLRCNENNLALNQDETIIEEEELYDYDETAIEDSSEYDENGHLERIRTADEEGMDFEEELVEVINYFENKQYQNQINIIERINSRLNESVSYDEVDEYEQYSFGHEPIRSLNITIGSDDIPRFSCECHKNNIAVRLAISKCPPFANLGAFPPDDPSPASLVTVEYYLQILKPAFYFNLTMQKNKSSIGDVLPALFIMISKWSRMELTGNYRNLADCLISAFRHKFKDEIDSSVYCVASLLNVSKIKIWINRPDCVEIKRKALDNLIQVALNQTASSVSTFDSITALERDDDYLYEIEVNKEIEEYDLEREKIHFIKNIVDNSNFKTNSTAKFWNEDCIMPYLAKLAIVLWNIPSSSAYIERFYSICGLVSKRNAVPYQFQTGKKSIFKFEFPFATLESNQVSSSCLKFELADSNWKLETGLFPSSDVWPNTIKKQLNR
ncbi:zinc finger BED domain-containing 4-like [Brachionus plicatilis]|uniref:Zinc finger BED domain-containing 4-like n=1 Tax=Brachionus plicatilis TaxID=10195 RepID=A0A3M7RVT4_BRAPC|nr:zinc finger BED domain-containing 4-like [Brachionus plicatilis]